MMRHCGWQTAGVEIGAEASAIANRHDLNVFCGQVEDAPFPEASFDVIVLSQSLEHLYSPKSALRKIHRLLKSDGVLIVGVPNCDSFDQRLFRENWHAWDLPRHLFHFTPDSLRRYFDDAGFHVTEMRGKYLTPPNVTVQEVRRGVQRYSENRWYRYAAAAGYYFNVWCVKSAWFLVSKCARASFGVYIAAYATKK
jgi:SAM-dependent methyltransferase